ncbi:hypothetical protein GT028_20345 [Streptomyces sp. SID2999]|uniref:hypothetical protein n=1 Tax=Streptomyces sp. SID2999 TaxID=2690258 RepID=UPI00136E61E4|nr:hypothetical protein [Streptomyces sp. SID2999]MYZ09706.1 hypothetical protein [Streptomyces sp. SID2999]
MNVWVPYLILCGGLVMVLGALTWLALHVRRRGGAGGVLAAYEEAFRATSHAAHQEIRAEAERKTPADSPDGPFRRTR